MQLALFQPPYPEAATSEAATACLAWMRQRLDALESGAQDLVLLPEYANAPGLGTRQAVRDFAQGPGAVFLQAVAASARRLGCLVAVSAAVADGDRWFNRSLVFGPAGEVVCTYDKVHLTDVERDELGLTPGTEATVRPCSGVRLGFATCFDAYFPEHFEALAARRAELVLCSSYQRSETAERLRFVSQTRALDSGTYLLRSSYAMPDPRVGGRSLVAAPDGALLADAGADACVLRVRLDPRHKFTKPASHGRPPVEHRTLIEAHRRPQVYRTGTQPTP